MGHSAAGHSTTEYLVGTCGSVKLHILLDPVDGVDPFGVKKDYIITPGKLLPYATPVLVIAAELDPVRRELAPAACAPAHLSNARYSLIKIAFMMRWAGPSGFWMSASMDILISTTTNIGILEGQYARVATRIVISLIIVSL